MTSQRARVRLDGSIHQGVTGFDFVRCGRGSEPRKPTSSRESVVGKLISAKTNVSADFALAA